MLVLTARKLRSGILGLQSPSATDRSIIILLISVTVPLLIKRSPGVKISAMSTIREPFRGLIPKTSISEDSLKRIGVKIEDIKKSSQMVVEYYNLVNKGIELYNTGMHKQVEVLEQYVSGDMSNEKRFFLQVSMVFKAIWINHSNLYSCLEASLKEYHMTTNIEIDELTSEFLENALMHYRKYKTCEDSLYESHKKYLKLSKQLDDNITSYKSSFSDVKLIYNKEETVKRYTICENTYRLLIAEEQALEKAEEKALNQKKELMQQYNLFVAEYVKTINFLEEKIIIQSKDVLGLICNTHKMIISDIASTKRGLEETKIIAFLQYNPQFNNPEHYMQDEWHEVDTRFPVFIGNYKYIKDEYLMSYTRWLMDYQTYLKDKYESSKKVLKKVYQFLFDHTKVLEKMASFIIKDVSVSFDKLKKKLAEYFGVKCTDFVRSINSSLEVSMRIYEKLIKILYTKLDSINNFVQQDAKIGEMFFKELQKHIEPIGNSLGGMTKSQKNAGTNSYPNQQSQDFNTLSEEAKAQIRKFIGQKSEIIKHFLLGFGEKIGRNNELLRVEISSIINEIFTSFNQIYLYASEYQQTYFGLEFPDSLRKVKQQLQKVLEKNGSPESISNELCLEAVKLEDSEKYHKEDFLKMRKPSIEPSSDEEGEKNNMNGPDEVLNKDGEGVQNAKESTPARRSNSLVVPEEDLRDGKEKKNFDFLKSKINFQEDQKLLHTYGCGLADKIILTGRLFVTTHRICFHSYFNVANVFFGGTFLQIPKKDIKKVQKRFNAIIFDNSLAITTVNGEVFFTSFFKRDEAFTLITETYEIDIEQVYNDNNPVGQKTPSNGEVSAQKAERPAQLEPITVSQEPIETVVAVETEPEETDNVGQQQQKQRQQKLQGSINNSERKYEKLVQGVLQNATCIEILKQIIEHKDIRIKNKTYPAFVVYFKESIGEKDVKPQKWVPSLSSTLNTSNTQSLHYYLGNIKAGSPLSFTRRVVCTHPIANSGIPFMPKSCESIEDQTLYLVNKDFFFLDSAIQNKGAPYADNFRVHIRTEYRAIPDTKSNASTIY